MVAGDMLLLKHCCYVIFLLLKQINYKYYGDLFFINVSFNVNVRVYVYECIGNIWFQIKLRKILHHFSNIILFSEHFTSFVSSRNERSKMWRSKLWRIFLHNVLLKKKKKSFLRDLILTHPSTHLECCKPDDFDLKREDRWDDCRRIE